MGLENRNARNGKRNGCMHFQSHPGNDFIQMYVWYVVIELVRLALKMPRAIVFALVLLKAFLFPNPKGGIPIDLDFWTQIQAQAN